MQSNTDIDFWKFKKMKIPEPMEYIPKFSIKDPNAKELSYEHLPGHLHFMNYSDVLSFESCWQMYFGVIYYKYIPKPLFDAFSDSMENTIIEQGTRRITLYPDVHKYGTPENIAKQWAFRRQLGIDSIAHELTKSDNRIEPTDLPVLITKLNCEIGTTRVTRFLDKMENLVPQSKSVKTEITEYGDTGLEPLMKKII
jgi:hypothetical protein